MNKKDEVNSRKSKFGHPESILMKRLMSLALLLCLVGFLLLAFAIRLKHTGTPHNRMDSQYNWQDLNTFARQYHQPRHIEEPVYF